MPPAATSGSETARRTATISASRPTTLCTWPPASTPCTIRPSAPASAAARAACAEATWTSTRAPPACARATSSGRSPNENDTHATRSSTATSRRSSCSKSSTRLTQNGRSVARMIERICSRKLDGSVHDAPSVPSPPARDTSAASADAAPRPSGACMTGTSQPSALTARAYTAPVVAPAKAARCRNRTHHRGPRGRPNGATRTVSSRTDLVLGRRGDAGWVPAWRAARRGGGGQGPARYRADGGQGDHRIFVMDDFECAAFTDWKAVGGESGGSPRPTPARSRSGSARALSRTART